MSFCGLLKLVERMNKYLYFPGEFLGIFCSTKTTTKNIFLSDDKWVESNLFSHTLMKLETYCLQRTQKLNSDFYIRTVDRTSYFTSTQNPVCNRSSNQDKIRCVRFIGGNT